MNFDIKNISGSTILSVPVTESAVSHEELMQSDYMQLSWSSITGETIPAGAYIEHGGEKYSLLEPYAPERLNEAEYKYTPQFQSRIMLWQKHPVPLYIYDDDGTTIKTREFDWEFTGSPADVMYMVQQAIKNETGEEWSVQLADNLPATITLSSQTSSIFALLSEIAGQCETEWWADKATNTLYLSQCKQGTEVALTVGGNVKVPSVTGSKDGYFTRFYVFGSTRNVTQGASDGTATNSTVNKRLTLDPVKYPGGYIDSKGHFGTDGVFVSDLQDGEIFTTKLIFDDIYPSSKLAISDVRARLKYRLDSNGNKIQTGADDEGNPVYEQYAIWYFQIADFSFDPETIIEGMNLSVSFETGQLAGRDFELAYHEKAETVNDGADVVPFNILAGDYEIIIDESTGTIIPGLSYIIPQNGDQIVLYNIEMPAEYTVSARSELETKANTEITRRMADNNSYEFDSNPVDFYENGTDLSLGRAVTFTNNGNTLSTRVLMVEKHLDFPCQQRIRVGNEIIKGNTQQLREEVTNANQNIDIIQAFNDLSKSLYNTYGQYQREMTAWVAAMKNMWQFDPEHPDTIYSIYNVYTTRGLSALGFSPDMGGGGGGGGATTLGELANVGEWADEVPQADRVMVQLAGATHWSSKPLSELVGLDEEALATYLVEYGYATQGWVNTKLGSYATTASMNSSLAGKVDKVSGKGLSSNDFTDALLTKLNGIEEGANKYVLPTATGSVLGGVKVGATLAIASGVLNMKAVGTAGTYTKVTVDAYGRVTGHASLAATDIPNLPWSKITSGKPTTLAGYGITDAYTKTETNTKLSAKLDKATFEELFEKVELSDGTFAIHAKFGLYSDSFLSALGMNPDIGGGGGGTSYDRLDAWADYSAEKAGWVLSAALGEDLNTRVAALEGGAGKVSLAGITDLHSTWDALLKAAKPATLAGYGIEDAYTKSAADGRYVLKTGDTMTGTLCVQFDVDTSRYMDMIRGYNASGTTRTFSIGYHNTVQNLILNPTGVGSDVWSDKVGNYSLIVGNNKLSYNTYDIVHMGNLSLIDSRYVKKTGDTMTGNLVLPARSGSGGVFALSSLLFSGNTGRIGVNSSGAMGFYALNNITLRPNCTTTAQSNYSFIISSDSLTYNGNKVWHAGNDGSGSGLDADLLDGLHEGSFARFNNRFVLDSRPFRDLGYAYDVNGWPFTGPAIAFGADASYSKYIGGPFGSNTLLLGTNNNGTIVGWREFAFTDSNVASATKLQTARTIWGQSFDGTAPVSGNMTGVGSITMSGGIKSSASPFYIDSTSGDIALRRGTSNANGVSLANGNFRPISTSSGASGITLGSSTYRWANVYSVLGNFSGLVTINGRSSIGCSGFGVGLQLIDTGNTSLEIVGGSYVYGLGAHSNSSFYMWRGTQGHSSSTGKKYILQYNGSDWIVWGNIRPQSNNIYTIGTSSYRWNYGYFTNLNTNSLRVNGTTTLSGAATLSSTLAVTGLATMNGGVHTPNGRYYSTFNTAGKYCAIAGIDASNYVFFGTTENTAGTIIRAYSAVLFNFNGLNNSVRINKEGIWAQNGIWTDGYVSALGQNTSSDMRLKDKLADIRLPVEAVAAAPAMLFVWKRNGLRDVGSSAQYWQGILPEAVKERGGWLEMEYGNLALVSAISIAKKVVSHEERIAQLEKENIGLKNKIKELERRTA